MTNNCNSVNRTHLIFRSVKAATEAWIDLENESEEEEIYGEEKEKNIIENYCFEVDLIVK